MPPYSVPPPHAGWRRRWQSRLLKDERLRHLSFMDSSKLSRGGRGGMQKELHLLLDRVGHRVYGELLLDGNYAVNKMKSELLHAGEESSSGSVKLVQALTKPALEWEYVGTQQKLIESYTQWLQKHEKHDDNYRFVFEGGDVEKASSPLSGYVRPLHPLHPLRPLHPHRARALMPRVARTSGDEGGAGRSQGVQGATERAWSYHRVGGAALVAAQGRQQGFPQDA